MVWGLSHTQESLLQLSEKHCPNCSADKMAFEDRRAYERERLHCIIPVKAIKGIPFPSLPQSKLHSKVSALFDFPKM